MKFHFLFFYFIFFVSSSVLGKVDDSIELFFPKNLKSLASTQTDFSYFWWNFIIVDPVGHAPNFKLAQQICTHLVEHEKEKINQIICADQFKSALPKLKDWALDLPFRVEFPQEVKEQNVFLQKINQTLAQSAMMADSEIQNLYRHDPFLEWQDYLQKIKEKAPTALQMESGYLVEPKSQKVLIPIQFSVPPKMKNTETIYQYLAGFSQVSFVGAHASSYSNEKQVHDDLQIVSSVGLLVLLAFAIFLVFKKRKNMVLLYIPVFIAVGAASFLTELIYGSIHGLTLAFGSGIVGLVLDYGLHGAFNIKSTQTWKSNTIGVITTLIGLSCVLFCSIPLFQQMMVFSILGLGIGYVLFYFICQRYSNIFSAEGFYFHIPDNKTVSIMTLVLAVLSLLVVFKTSWSLDLKSMNFQTEKEFETAKWLFETNNLGETYFKVYPQQDFEKIQQQETEFKAKAISYDGISEYLPTLDLQKKNLQSWKKAFCKDGHLQTNLKLSNVAEKYFEPFFSRLCVSENLTGTKSYLSHLVSGENNLSVLRLKDPSEAKALNLKEKGYLSIAETMGVFSLTLTQDLRWITVLVLVTTCLLLYWYYRNVIFVLSANIPFLTGAGLYFLFKFFSHQEIDLMGLVGLIMVFCFSLDYGIFATDIKAFPQSENNAVEVRTSLSFAAISNLLGYLPLVFAQHVVLHQLGLALFLGTVGTFLGAIWGCPRVAEIPTLSRKEAV